MTRGWFRRSMPRGLFGRSLVIIVMPVVVLQAVVTYLLFDRQWDAVTTRISRGVAAQIALFVQSYETLGPEKFVGEAARLKEMSFGLVPVIKPGEKIPDTESPAFEVLKQVFVRELQTRTGRPVWLDSESLDDEVDIRVQLDGAVMQIMAERKRVMSTNTHVWVLWSMGTALILLSVAVLFLRNQIRPIERLADVAEAFGKGRDVPDFRPAGATEVRRAGLAFLDMKERISRFVQQRTDMLAGVSHDLRTPLTRMKLELAMMKDPSAEALKGDLEEMEHMLEEYLAFARGQAGEGASDTDIGQLVRDVAASAQRKISVKTPSKKVDVTVGGDLVLEIRPNAMRRCVTNLVENALRYGSRATVSANQQNDVIEIAVDDDGPGIPPDRREEAFRPFHRLDSGRTLAGGGGVGLGLAIARDIARGHGGDITLSESKLGGLRAVVRLPV
jgi:two-component system, OmpR family, osmolarity sensor histidine kinase EnvZ